MPLAAGDTLLGLHGTYLIESPHGSGSFGVTFRARETTSNEPVIVKELRLDKLEDWKALELFEREGEVLSTLSHPNIPAFRDFFAAGSHGAPPRPVRAIASADEPARSSLVLVQQYIEGTTLQQHVDQGHRMPPTHAAFVLRGLLEALRYLHERVPPLIHRDVKPGNVILTPHGQPYLVDFGAIQNRLRNAGSVGSTVVGTLGFMPLEQIRGDTRPASDLYALGVTMVVALAGRPVESLPFDDHTGALAVRRVVSGDTPEPLVRVLEAMVAPMVGQRIPSAAAALAMLDAPAFASPPRAASGS